MPSSCLNAGSCSSSTIIKPKFRIGSINADLAPTITPAEQFNADNQICLFFVFVIPECQTKGAKDIVNDELKSKIYQMAENAVKLEDKFIQLAFKGNSVQGLTKKEVRDYIRHIADRRLLQLGLKPLFKQKTNPLPWLDWVLNGASHDNFFEKRVTEYSVNGMEGEDYGWEELEAEVA